MNNEDSNALLVASHSAHFHTLPAEKSAPHTLQHVHVHRFPPSIFMQRLSHYCAGAGAEPPECLKESNLAQFGLLGRSSGAHLVPT